MGHRFDHQFTFIDLDVSGIMGVESAELEIVKECCRKLFESEKQQKIIAGKFVNGCLKIIPTKKIETKVV